MQSNVVICMGELTKFGLVPDHIVFHTMKVLLDDFSPVAIEMLALLIETCGRYLYRMPLTMTRMQSMLDLMRRKRMAHNLSEQHSLLLDNAYYKCVPPERPVIVHREPTVMEQFITYLFTSALMKWLTSRLFVTLLRWKPSSTAISSTIVLFASVGRRSRIY